MSFFLARGPHFPSVGVTTGQLGVNVRCRCLISFRPESERLNTSSRSSFVLFTRCDRRDILCFTRGSPVAVSGERPVRLSAGLLHLPVHQPLLARPAPPLAGRLLLVILVPRHPKKQKDVNGEEMRDLSPPPTFRNLGLQSNNCSNWTVIMAASEPGGLWLSSSLLSGEPVSDAVSRASDPGRSFYSPIKSQSWTKGAVLAVIRA